MTTSQHELHADPVLIGRIQAHMNGVATLAVRGKNPARTGWTNHTPTLEEIQADHANPHHGHTGYGAATGAISDGLELFELEAHAIDELADLQQHFADHDQTDLWDKFNACTAWSQSGGIHFIGRIDWEDQKPAGNKRLAKDAHGVVKAETRGQGGMFVGAGSVFPGSDPVRCWKWRTGGWNTIPVFTLEERQIIVDMFQLLDETPAREPAQPAATNSLPSQPSEVAQVVQGDSGGHRADDNDGLSPGNDFNQRADWKDILPDWPEKFRDNHKIYLTRPGKPVSEGPSATISLKDQRLWVFTTSTEFEPERLYDKFGAYTQLTEGSTSDAALSRAASKLRKQGYGTPTKPKARKRPSTSQDNPQQAGSVATIDNPSVRPSGQLLMAYRFEEEHKYRLRYAHGIGWIVWDGTRWAIDDKDRAKLAVTNVLKNALAESLNDEQLRKDVRSCERASGINGVLDIASALPGIRISAKDLDADPYLLNTKTGTYDLRTDELRPHDPADLITKVTGTGYDPTATAPTWTAFLESSLPDANVRDFLQRVIGVALVGKVLEHFLPLGTGTGRNGKGVAVRTVSTVLGDYAITATNRMLIAGRYKQASAGEQASLMRLRGARLAVMSELEKGDRLAESTMKSLTGGDTIEAKLMHQNPVEFEPSHTFLMITNDLPKVDADDPAVWARLLVVPFTESFIGREDHGLEDRLKLELAGILGWAIQGWHSYKTQGLNPPEAVRAKTDSYRLDNNEFAQFLDEMCVVDPSSRVTRTELNAAYKRWADNNAATYLSPRETAPKMRELGFGEGKIQGWPTWKGIGLKNDQSTFD